MKTLKICMSCDFYFWDHHYTDRSCATCPKCAAVGERLPFDHEDLDMISLERDRLKECVEEARLALNRASEALMRIDLVLMPRDQAEQEDEHLKTGDLSSP